VFFTRFGKIKEYARTNRTYTDIDERTAVPLKRIWWISRVLGVKPKWIRYDSTKHGWHIVIEWPAGTFRTRCPSCSHTHYDSFAVLALQAIIGSDFRREALNFMRLMSLRRDRYAMAHWNILYEKKLYK